MDIWTHAAALFIGLVIGMFAGSRIMWNAWQKRRADEQELRDTAVLGLKASMEYIKHGEVRRDSELGRQLEAKIAEIKAAMQHEAPPAGELAPPARDSAGTIPPA